MKTAEDLLAEFEQTSDPAPFEEIVRRYSGMVYGVCYRVTRNAHDAEDATQATFLKLATHARSGNPTPRIGPWLQQVAKTTAVDLRRSKTRRQNREQIRAAIEDQQQPATDATDDVSMDELKQLLRDEIDGLPVHYRTPLILYYFGGLSTEQIGVQLKTNAKALAVRLFRARKMLAVRLTERGVVTAGGAMACLTVADAIVGALAGSVWKTSAGSAAYASATSAGASGWLTSHSAVVATISERVSATLRTCTFAVAAGKWKMSLAVLLTVGTSMAGSSEAVRQSQLIRDVGQLLQEISQTLQSIGRLPRMFKGTAPQLQASADVPATDAPPGQATPGLIPFKPMAVAQSRLPSVEAARRVAVARPSQPAAPMPPLHDLRSPVGLGGEAYTTLSAAAGSYEQYTPVASGTPRISASAGASLLAIAGGNVPVADDAADRRDTQPPAIRAAATFGSALTTTQSSKSSMGPVALAHDDVHALLGGRPTSKVGPYAAKAGTAPESDGDRASLTNEDPAAQVAPASPIVDSPTSIVSGPGSSDYGNDFGYIGTGSTPAPDWYSGRNETPELTGGNGEGLIATDPQTGLPATGPLPTQGVPEPSGVLLLLAGGAGLLARRRSRRAGTAERSTR